jgi:hypothetical protein
MVNNMNSEDDNSCIISNIITNVTTCKHESFINKNDKEAATTTATTTTVTDVTAAVAAETKTKTKTNNNNNNNNNIQKKKVSFSYSDITDIDDDDLATTAAAAAAAAAAAPEQMSIKDLNNWSFSSMGSNNNSNSNNNNSNSKIKLKKGMINSNKSSNKIKSSVTASSATYDDDVMIKDLNEWVGVTKATSNSVTGVLLCSMIERVAKDGKFSDKEELSVMASLACQQSLFGYLIVMDCLFLSMFLPLLVEDTLIWKGGGEDNNNVNGNGNSNDDNDYFSSYSDISLSTFNVIKILYEINVSFVFFSCCVHVMVCGLFLGLSSYLMDARSVLWMLVHCHGNFIFINDAMFPIFIGVIMTGMLGSVLRIGVVQSVPAIIFATLAVVSSIGYFNKIIRPLFFLLSTTGDGTWIANEEVDETLGRNTTKVLKKLLKSNNRNNTRSSMINIFDRIDADGDGNGEVSLDTLRNGIGKTSIMLTDYELKALFQAVDKDGDGVISRKEWETLVNEETALDCSIPFANTAAAYANTTTSTEYETEEIS